MVNSTEYRTPSEAAARTGKWAVIITKQRIHQITRQRPFPYWHLIEFRGPNGGEAKGVVDLIAIRKDHSESGSGTKCGDKLQIVLIQVKGGNAAWPTADDRKRLRFVARYHRANKVLLAVWKKGKGVEFFSLQDKPVEGAENWARVSDPSAIFC
ncbi:MAG: hypothetical protein ABR898_11165 [Terracidiphilus sp.]|jgi:hypothetical protein